MTTLPNDIQRTIDQTFKTLGDRKYVAKRIASLWTTNLNVGADQLAKSILLLSKGEVKIIKEIFNTNFHGDPRDIILWAMEESKQISTEFETLELKQHKILRHFPTLLHKWKGKQMRLYNLTESHRSISIKLSNDRYNGALPCLNIFCIEPISMKGKFDYETSNIEIKQIGERYVVYDPVSGFELSCEGIGLTEIQNSR